MPETYRLSILTFDARRNLKFWPDALLAVDSQGRISSIGPLRGKVPGRTVDWRGRLAIPGLIDAHCHLSQYPAVAKEGLELLPWLKRHIFPLERNFMGEASRPLARHFFRELARHGTTCAAVYTSIWRDSTQVCFEEGLRSGLRLIMGKVMMDRFSYDRSFARANPGTTRREVSLRDSEDLCRLWHGRAAGRILYAFTPRFALSCSQALMRDTAVLAKRYGAYVQTHLAENRDEVAAVKRDFPEAPSYTAVYDRAGLLDGRAILAHSIWLKEPEYRLLGKRKSAVAHCPTSNAFLSSGVMNMARMRSGRIPLALGSDVAAGPSLDLFSVMRQAVFSQRLMQGDAVRAEDVFYMATLGGAKALRLQDTIGSLEKEKAADFVVLDPKVFLAAPPKTSQDMVSQLVYRASREAVAATYVAGKRVWYNN